MDWIDLAQDRNMLRALVNAIINVRFPLGISCQAEDLLDSQEGLCSMDLVCLLACLYQSVSVKFNKLKPILLD